MGGHANAGLYRINGGSHPIGSAAAGAQCATASVWDHPKVAANPTRI